MTPTSTTAARVEFGRSGREVPLTWTNPFQSPYNYGSRPRTSRLTSLRNSCTSSGNGTPPLPRVLESLELHSYEWTVKAIKTRECLDKLDRRDIRVIPKIPTMQLQPIEWSLASRQTWCQILSLPDIHKKERNWRLSLSQLSPTVYRTNSRMADHWFESAKSALSLLCLVVFTGFINTNFE